MKRRKLVALALILTASSCVSRRVDLPPFIPPTREATLTELIEIVNERQKAQTLIVRTDLQFVTSEKAEEGVGRRYRSGQGRILLSRPELIRLNIEAPVLSVNIADMASDGERFQLLIYPEEYRALILGSNRRSYAEEARKLDGDPELRKAGPLVNIRPQHFTEAFLFQPIDDENPNVFPWKEEERLLEDDDRPGAEEGQKVIRSYYVLTIAERGEKSPRRKYWFDRTRDMALTRLQTFDEEGHLVGDVRFAKYLPAEPKAGLRIPSEIVINRPYEDYTLRITVKPDSVEVNRDIPETAFTLEPPPEWSDTLRRVDLDKKNE
jgi:hypothetical protein